MRIIGLVLLSLTWLSACVTDSRIWERVEQLSLEQLSVEPSSTLCAAYGYRTSEKAKDELNRRGEIIEADWEVIEAAGIPKGMSELAVICSLGRPASIEDTQETTVYTYGRCALVQFVYIGNGRVENWQLPESNPCLSAEIVSDFIGDWGPFFIPRL